MTDESTVIALRQMAAEYETLASRQDRAARARTAKSHVLLEPNGSIASIVAA
jgi:hypothetical protein